MFKPSMGLLVEDALHHAFDRLDWALYVDVSARMHPPLRSCHRLKRFRERQLHRPRFRAAWPQSQILAREGPITRAI
jgi:hypothetical protein